MSEQALHSRLPGRTDIVARLLQAVVVGGTLFVLDNAATMAAGAAALFAVVTIATDATEPVVGDYADNVVLGLLTLGFTGYLATVERYHPVLGIGLPVGGWLVFDGIQHLRHGETRDELSLPYSHDGGPVTGFIRAIGARLLEPFRL